MTEYVEKKTLENALTVAAAADSDKKRRTWVKAIRVLCDTPAADVAPVMHARWIRGVLGDNEPRCSNCLGYQPWFFGYGYYDPDHCPHCGAIMDLREQVDEDEQDL